MEYIPILYILDVIKKRGLSSQLMHKELDLLVIIILELNNIEKHLVLTKEKVIYNFFFA